MTKPIIILDTDFSTDPGDAFALVEAIQLHKMGLIDLRGVIVSSSNTKAPGAVSAYMVALNVSLPVAALQGLERDPEVEGNGDWVGHVYDNYTRTLGLANTVPDSTQTYTELLEAADDGSVTILALGGATCVDLLLTDDSSLVTAKVKELVWFAGDYPSAVSEFNIGFDTAAAGRVMTNLPSVITYVGLTECLNVRSANNLRLDLGSTDIVRKTLEVFDANALAYYGNVAYDDMTLMWALLRRSAFSEIRGTNAVVSGGNSFTASTSGKDAYVQRSWSNAQYVSIMNSLLAGSRTTPVATWPRVGACLVLS